MGISHSSNIIFLERHKTAILISFLGIALSFTAVFFKPVYLMGFLGLIVFGFAFLKKTQTTTLLLILTFPIIRGISESTTLFSGSALSINILGIMNILIPIMVATYLFLHRIRFSSFKLFKPVAIFVIYLLFGVFYSVSPFGTVREFFRILMSISFYFIIAGLNLEEREARKFLFAILLSAIVPLLVGGYQYVNRNCVDELSEMNRIFSTFGHPNVYAMFLVICILLTSYLYLSHNWLGGKIVLVSYLGVLFFSLFNTFARIGWGTCAFSLLSLGILMKKRFVLYVFASLVIIFLLVSSVSNLFLERIKPDYSSISRLAFNQVSLSFFAQRPILGAGLGSYQFLSLDVLGTRVEAYGKALGFGPHNDYFKFLVENGLIGLFLYLFLMYSGLRMGIKLYRSTDNKSKGYGAFLISLILLILLFGITDSGFAQAGMYLWILIGIIERKYRLENPETFDQTEQIR